MPQQGPLPYLNFCGVEIANAARTVSYLRRGLGNTLQGNWELGPGDPCGVLYRVDPPVSCLHPHVFVSPQADPAPWYDATEPGAKTFLGFHLLNIKGYDSTITRGIAQRVNSLGGGVFGGQTRTPRTWTFRGALISADDAGAEYGLRWLTQQLQASECDSCSTCELTVRLACPPSDCSNEQLGEWISYSVGLVDGPHEVDQSEVQRASMQDVLGGCRGFVLVEFTMVAENPYLYKRPQTLEYFTLTQAGSCTDICAFLFGVGASGHCVSVAPPARGVLGTVITLTSDSGFGGINLQAYASCSSTGVPIGDPALEIELSEIPPASTLVVDSAQHQITLAQIDPDTGRVVLTDGTNLVVPSANKSIEWLEVRDCDAIACLCFGAAQPCATGTVQVTVQSQAREG